MREQELSQLFRGDLILIGFQGSGKTTLGKRLAKQLGWKWFDTDAFLDLSLFWKDETAFRQQEKEVVRRLPPGPAVISTGGGTVLDPENVTLLQARGQLIYLDVPREELERRMKPPRDYEKRLSIYQTLADYTVGFDGEQ